MSRARLLSFSVERFKCYAEKTEVEFKPLTVILGRNNSGKSTLIQALLLLKQTLAHPRADVSLSLEGIVEAFGLRELTAGWPTQRARNEGPVLNLRIASRIDVNKAFASARDPTANVLADNAGGIVKPRGPFVEQITNMTFSFGEHGGHTVLESVAMLSEASDLTPYELRFDIGRVGDSYEVQISRAVPPYFDEIGSRLAKPEFTRERAGKIAAELDHFLPYLVLDRRNVGPRDRQRAWHNAFLILFAQPLDDLKRLLLDFGYLTATRPAAPPLYKAASAVPPEEIGAQGEYAAQILHARRTDVVHYLPPVSLTSPPFRVHREKKDLYLKDQAQLDRFFLEHGVDGLSVHASKGPTLTGDPLFRLGERLQMFRRALAKIDARADASIIGQVVHAAALSRIDLRERSRVDAAVPLILARLNKKNPDILPLTIAVDWEVEHGAATISIQPRAGAKARPVTLNWELFSSAEYEQLYAIEQDIRSVGPAPYFVREFTDAKSVETEIEDADGLLDYIDARGRKGTTVERLDERNAHVPTTVHASNLGDAVNDVLDALDIKAKVRTEDVADLGFRLLVGRASLPHVGRGLAYIFPVVEFGLILDPRRFADGIAEQTPEEFEAALDRFSHAAIEESEAHLHPKVQSQLANWLVSLAMTGRRLMVETHSDHLVRRLRRLVAAAPPGSALETWLRDNVSVLEVEQDEAGFSYVRRSTLTTKGSLERWPADFMDEATDEERAIYDARLEKETPSPAGPPPFKATHDEGPEPE